MRRGYIVSYDISEPKRLRKVYETMRGYGDHLQLSVFQCELSETERIKMIAELGEIINHDEDQILMVDLGPVPGRSDGCIQAIGKPYIHTERHAIVI